MKKYQNIVLWSTSILLAVQAGLLTESVLQKKPHLFYMLTQKVFLPKVLINFWVSLAKDSNQPFKDVSQSIYKNYINDIYKRGITTGYTYK